MHPDFNLPTKGSISGRTSSITASFFQAITPVLIPSDEEVESVINILGMSRGNVVCAYCGDQRTEWDHFRPTVIDKEPTGYITEIANLVPACGKCNQSKGNKNWKQWILSEAARSPKKRNVANLDALIKRLEEFETWGEPVKIDYKSVMTDARWSAYQELLKTAIIHLKSAQNEAKNLFKITTQHVQALKASTQPGDHN